MDNQEISPGVIWITGISGSGKTTLAYHLYEDLLKKGVKNVKVLDGEELRTKLDRKYGHSLKERFSILHNIVKIACEYNRKGIIVIVSTISHKREMREIARKNIQFFMEVYLDCSVDVCAKRDTKGHYKKALAGVKELFVGVTEPYETTKSPELVLDTASLSVKECSRIMFDKTLDFLHLSNNQVLPCVPNRHNLKE